MNVTTLLPKDVVPIPLGVEIENGGIITVFSEGMPVPCKCEFTLPVLCKDNGIFWINIVQGFSKAAKDNSPLLTVQASCESIKATYFHVRIKLEIDEYGILYVDISDPTQQTPIRHEITQHSAGLSDSEISEMRQQALKQ